MGGDWSSSWFGHGAGPERLGEDKKSITPVDSVTPDRPTRSLMYKQIASARFTKCRPKI